MIDDNISMEEDTELRELVVQTLENNGVLAKVRAELRASVFLTLEEQESVLNPEPFLNKSVKQYLSSSQGKILFSLVREFLEFFGLDYTISVYDPETYLGKEYNYVGRQKLCEKFGIDSKDPLLGELLKNTINSALIDSQKLTNESYNELQTSNKSTENIANATFDVSVPTIFPRDTISDCNNSSEKLESESMSNIEMPINVTITKKQNEDLVNTKTINSTVSTTCIPSPDEINKNIESHKEKDDLLENAIDQSNNLKDQINSNTSYINDDPSNLLMKQETCQNKKSYYEFHSVNNFRNKRQIEAISKKGKTVFFDAIIVDGIKEKISEELDDKSSLGSLPSLPASNNSIFGDLPPLNGKKADIKDLKEILDIAQGISYNEDLVSCASGSASEQSPYKGQFTLVSPETYINKQIPLQNTPSESEEIDEEVPSNTSCLENSTEKKAEKLIVINTKNNNE